MTGKIENVNALKYILAGKSLFTVKNEQTGNRFTFKVINLQRINKSNPDNLWFVKILTSSDNENGYRFIGTVYKNGTYHYKHSSKARISQDAPSVKVFMWLLTRLNAGNLPEIITFYHEGRCGRCGRRLTVPESIISGFGPECINYV